jgi:hypothetical protein
MVRATLRGADPCQSRQPEKSMVSLDRKPASSPRSGKDQGVDSPAGGNTAAPQPEAERSGMPAAEDKGKQRAQDEKPAQAQPARGSSTLRLPVKHGERKHG